MKVKYAARIAFLRQHQEIKQHLVVYRRRLPIYYNNSRGCQIVLDIEFNKMIKFNAMKVKVNG